MDRIYIRDLLVRCIVGVYPEERHTPQDVVINIVLHADLRKPCQSDQLEDSIDYKAVKQKVLQLTGQSSDQLIERLAQRVADACLEDHRVQEVEVTIDKPGALRFARSVAVQITRSRVNES